MVKILLIAPPFYRLIGYFNRYFPLGLAYLAAQVKSKGHESLIYDADCNINPSKMDFTRLQKDYPLYLELLKQDSHPIWQEARETIRSFNPDIVGISVWTTFAASAFKIASIVKTINKDLPVILGGPHITVKFREVLRICNEADFLVRGEGEKTFSELIKVLQGPVSEDKLKNIKGISYNWKGKTVHNSPRGFIQNLDSIPLPERHLLLNKTPMTPKIWGS